MAIDLLAIALEFLARYGLLAVFILLVLDGALLLPVLPGEIIMIMAVTQYANDLQDLVLLVGVATAAAMVGSLMLFGVSRAGYYAWLGSEPTARARADEEPTTRIEATHKSL